MPTILTRRTSGILYLNGVETVLRGGSYDLFYDPGRCPEGIWTWAAGRFQPHVVGYESGECPIQKEADRTRAVELLAWNEDSRFDAFFASMEQTRCNFVRVFLGGATATRDGKPIVSKPFHFAGGKYDVQGALQGRWRAAYFTRLRDFVAKADEKGVVVQLSLFNYRELAPDAWSLSPWNAANSPPGAWTDAHLIPAGVPPQRAFIAPPAAGMKGSRVREVQAALIVRVMQALSGFGNVVLEVMNEPRGVRDLGKFADFGSFVAGTIHRNRAATGCHALISVNASILTRVTPDPRNPALRDTSDVDVWRDRGLPHYEAVDLVSYHQLTAFQLQSATACGQSVAVPRLDEEAIRTRRQWHVDRHPSKALMLSTDAVSVAKFAHRYPDGSREMNIREGQILPKPEGSSREEQLLRNHVFHWARRCLVHRIHFHNDATYRLPLLRIARAARAAGLQPATVEETEVFEPV